MKLLPGFVCAAVLAIILTLGLWPFHAPANHVAWLSDRPGLVFGGAGSVISSGRLEMPPSGESAGGSAEIWLRPSHIWDIGAFLGFYDSGNPFKLSFRQSQTNLEIRLGKNMLLARHVFRKATTVFLTIASGANGTAVYVDGAPARTVPQMRLSAGDFTGGMVAGDSPGQGESWRGQLFGLAIYHRELTPEEAARHYRSWMQHGQPGITAGERAAALYLLNERKGTIVYNDAQPGPDLSIPERYTVADKIFLEPFWREFSLSWSYWSSAAKNIVGFVPLGFCFYVWFAALGLKRAGVVTVAFGTAVSLTIEILQAFLPTRDSGTTDIFTNTLGTWIGVAGYRVTRPLLAKALSLAFVGGGYGLPD